MNGSHRFDVRAKDAAGNVDPNPESRTWISEVVTEPPALYAPGDVALGKTATASSTQAAEYDAALANDGLSTTRWSSAFSDTEWWQVDLGAIHEVAGVNLNWEYAYASHYRILTSRDGVHFSEVADVTIGAAGWKRTAFATRAARYVRIESVHRATGWGVSLWDAQVYGPNETAPDTTIDSGPSGTTSSNSASVGSNSTESGSSFECRLDGGAWVACSSPMDYTGLATGSHTFQVRATDVAGNIDASPASRTWTVAPPADTTAPTVQVTTPSDGASVSGTVAVSADAQDAGGVAQVEFLLDGQVRATDSQTPFGFNWDTSAVPNGSHVIQARATDATGNQSSSSVTVNVDNVSAGPGVQAKQADSLVDSIGVNVHLNYRDTSYRNYDGIIRPRLLELGVRHVRDGLPATTYQYDHLNDLASVGIKANVIIGDPDNRWGSLPLTQQLDALRTRVRSAVESVEGPNEYNSNAPDKTVWIGKLRTYQQQLYSGIKGNSTTASLRVVCPSLTTREAYEDLGDLSAYCNNGNMHNYYGGFNPGTSGWGSCKYGSCYGSLEHGAAMAQLNAGAKPVFSTETGWHDAVPSDTTHAGTPRVIVGRDMPRLYLLQYLKGVPRSYPYELIDQWDAPGDAERSFGLLRYDGTPKPSFNAVKAMISLLEDPGASFSPGRLDFSVGGNTTEVKTALFQKRDGTFYLAVWLEVPGNTVATSTMSNVTPRPLSISLPSRYSSVRVHTLDDSGAMSSVTRSVSGSLSLSATDRVSFVQIGP